MSEAWIALCAEGDVEEGDVMQVTPDGLPPVAVFNVEGDYYVTTDRCTHAEASLSDGTVDGTTVECPFHGGCFNIRTGEAIARPARKPLETFDVRVAEGTVMARRRTSEDSEGAVGDND